MVKTKYTNKDHLEHFKKQLALREKFVKGNNDKVVAKCLMIKYEN